MQQSFCYRRASLIEFGHMFIMFNLLCHHTDLFASKLAYTRLVTEDNLEVCVSSDWPVVIELNNTLHYIQSLATTFACFLIDSYIIIVARRISPSFCFRVCLNYSCCRASFVKGGFSSRVDMCSSKDLTLLNFKSLYFKSL